MFFAKENRNGCTLNASVSCGKRSFKVTGFDQWKKTVKISLKEKPVGGKANKELEKELGKLFSAKTAVVSGHKSKEKRIFVEAEKKQVEKRLAEMLEH